ncbi:hypothetical protein A2661_01145 [Candidatus Giovannonibacteria bacterium RIFCSPHIGHO2_01_FULL_45_24]|uniref:Yeast cell wall synthesis Kre9/Knh1-like N-terminal domain-containing protein n=1 Tax=Candidatus Giovannonibacteria bacterium RIFCSPLOWO2_01_FULL_46_32 TaxID=1798353 RepID=A0A1F5XHB3_9BACT|nr:MAG: hypothetical protein A2661_01145 [Candidatus Giovannonibacteria bacterium RIFCSPHIGHO2_01_FULL_45_24]OGF87308.1 MAG: hypothetical protein A3B19_03740 [Candidatus Giovannonibacteria bacterium RIFCSPLOWO2_01_FULL_46_32]
MENHKEELAQKGLKAFQKEFLVIGRTHIKAWHAWLVLGLVAGITAGVLFVANRSGKFSFGLAEGNAKPVISQPVLPSGKTPAEESASFTFTASDADNDDLAWFVEWGDDSVTYWDGEREVASESELCLNPGQNQKGWTFNASHSWRAEQIYRIGAAAWDCKSDGVADIVFQFFVGVGAGTPQISSPNLSGPYTVGGSYNFTLRGSGGYPPDYTWRLDAGSPGPLPPNFTLQKSATNMGSAELKGSFATPGSYAYTITLSDGQKQSSKQFTTIVRPRPSVDIKANDQDGDITIQQGSHLGISWTSSNSDSCAASPEVPALWSGAKPASGSQNIGPFSGTVRFGLTCKTSQASASDSVTVTSVPLPSVDLKGNGSDGPITIPYNTSLALSWTSSNATSCNGEGHSSWSGAKAISGSQTIAPLTNGGTNRFSLTCTGSGGSRSDGVTVTVASQPTQQSSFNVTSPNGGESWKQKSTHKIKWTSTSKSKKVSISLENPSYTLIINSNTDNDGLFEWTIPKNVPPGQYQITIADASKPSDFDRSDAPFSIVP